jgi:hypothetical protein
MAAKRLPEWIRWKADFTVDEEFLSLPKAVRCEAYLFFEALVGKSRCSKSDGRISLPVAEALARTMEVNCSKLLEVLSKPEINLIRIEAGSIVTRAYQKWQDSAEEITRRSEAGRLAGAASGASRRSKSGSNDPEDPNPIERTVERFVHGSLNGSFTDRSPTVERSVNESRTKLEQSREGRVESNSFYEAIEPTKAHACVPTGAYEEPALAEEDWGGTLVRICMDNLGGRALSGLEIQEVRTWPERFSDQGGGILTVAQIAERIPIWISQAPGGRVWNIGYLTRCLESLTTEFQSDQAIGPQAIAARHSDREVEEKAQKVFQAWSERWMPGTPYGRDRQRTIEARLREGYGVQDLIRAVTAGIENDPWEFRRAPGGTEICQILKTSGSTDKFIALAESTPQAKLANLASGDQWSMAADYERQRRGKLEPGGNPEPSAPEWPLLEAENGR